MSDQPVPPAFHQALREFRADLTDVKTQLALLVESNARLERQVIGNGKIGLSDKVAELEDLIERMSEIQMRHLREDKERREERRAMDAERRESAEKLKAENRQFKRNIILAALGVILTNIGAWVIFYITNA